MPTAIQKDFIVDKGLDANESLTIGNDTVTSLLDSALVTAIGTSSSVATTISLAGGASAKAYDSADVLPGAGNDSGDFAFVSSTNRLYLWNGNGWFNIALINTTPNVSTFPDSNYEVNGAGQVALTVTMLATDPEGLAIAYSATSETASNFVTITQDSGVFTLTPITLDSASSAGISTGTFSVTFRASDGINVVPRVSSFTISFVVTYNWTAGTQQAGPLGYSGGGSNNFIGWSNGIDKNGNQAIVGAKGKDSSKGGARVWNRSGSTWNQSTELQAIDRGSTGSGQFGYAVRMSSDGNFAIIGAPFSFNSSRGHSPGASYVFRKTDGTWQQNKKLEQASSANDDYQGWHVDITKDGGYVISGAYGASTKGGAYDWKNNGEVTYTLDGSAYVEAHSGISGTDNQPVAFLQNAAGTKSFLLGDQNNKIYQYTMSVANSVNSSNMTYDSVSFDLSSQMSTPFGMRWNNDGTKIFVLDRSSRYVYEYNLSTAYDITSMSYTSGDRFYITSDADPQGIDFKPDGTKMYIVHKNAGQIGSYTLSTAFDITTASYDSQAVSVSSQDNGPAGVAFSPDGVRMIVAGAGSSGGVLFQYTLSTPWSINTASYDSISQSDLNEHSPRQITFSSDGQLLFFPGLQSDRVKKFSSSTVSWTEQAFLTSSDLGSSAEAGTAVSINSADGTLAVIGAPNHSSFAGAAVVFQRSGSTWTQIDFIQPDDVAGGDKFGYMLDMDKDGDTILAGSYQQDPNSVSNAGAAYVFTKTGFGISQLTHLGFRALRGTGNELEDQGGIAFNSDGTKVFLVGSGGNTGDLVIQYTLSTAYDLSTASYNNVKFSVASQTSMPTGIHFKPDGTKMFIVSTTTNSNNTTQCLFRYSLSTAFDLSTASYDSVALDLRATSDGDIERSYAMVFNNDGTKMFVLDRPYPLNARVAEYALSTAYDITTFSYTRNFNVNSQSPYMMGLAFNSDGTIMITASDSALFKYKLTTGFDLSTASYTSVTTSLTSYSNNNAGIAFNPDGSKLYVCCTSDDGVDEYKVGQYTQHTKLIASDYATNDNFGESVSIDGDGKVAVVGARRWNSETGKFYVFTKYNNVFYQRKIYQASNAGSDDQFARDVCVSESGSHIIVGADKEDSQASNAGAAYIFNAPEYASGNVTNYGVCVVDAILEGADNNEAMGESVAINKDGTLLAVGLRNSDHNGNSNGGAVRVYKKSGGTWTLKQTLTSNQHVSGQNNYYGKSLTMAADDYTIVVGKGSAGYNARGVHVWTSSDNGESWSTQANLLGSGVVGSDTYGEDGNIDISDDGNTLVIGAKFDDDSGTDAGAVYVYTRSGTTWTFRQKLNASKPAGARFGTHCRLSGDGQRLAIGAPYEDAGGTDRGTVVVYYTPNNGAGWNMETSFQSTDIGNSDYFGNTLAIDTDGDTLAVSSDSTTARSVYVFTRSGTTWSQQAKLVHPNAASGDNFGYGNQNPVISGDGNILYIGSNGDDDNGNNAGRGFIFTRSGSTWTEVGSNFTPLASNYAAGGLRGVEAQDYFGSRLAISRDGSTFAAGSEFHTNNSGLNTGGAYVMRPLLESY